MTSAPPSTRMVLVAVPVKNLGEAAHERLGLRGRYPLEQSLLELSDCVHVQRHLSLSFARQPKFVRSPVVLGPAQFEKSAIDHPPQHLLERAPVDVHAPGEVAQGNYVGMTHRHQNAHLHGGDLGLAARFREGGVGQTMEPPKEKSERPVQIESGARGFAVNTGNCIGFEIAAPAGRLS